MNTRDFAVVVAISHYTDKKSFGPLLGPQNDADDFVDWLKSPDGGALPPENIIQLYSSEDGKKPTASDVQIELGNLFTREREEDHPIGRRLYVFLAGHGFTPSVNMAMLHTAESKRVIPAYVSGMQWADCFFQNALFDEILVCMDCCRDFEQSFMPPAVPCANTIDTALKTGKRLYLMATSAGAKSYEREIDGKVRGAFSHAFVSVLRDAADGDGRLTAADLSEKLTDKFDPTKGSSEIQFPQPLLFGNFVLFDDRAPRSTRVEITLRDPATTLRMYAGDDSDLANIIAPVSSAAGVIVYELPRRRSYLAMVYGAAGNVVGVRPFPLRDEVYTATV